MIGKGAILKTNKHAVSRINSMNERHFQKSSDNIPILQHIGNRKISHGGWVAQFLWAFHSLVWRLLHGEAIKRRAAVT